MVTSTTTIMLLVSIVAGINQQSSRGSKIFPNRNQTDLKVSTHGCLNCGTGNITGCVDEWFNGVGP